MDAVPTKLKTAEIGRFVHRANQLRKFKPAIAYWCDYYAVQQILAKQLHSADQECLAFTTDMMDRLEKTKAQYADDDAVVDDVAGQAYVEQFAQETFDRAERVMQANKVNKNTADTFDAAATFFQLSAIWSPPDDETQKKIKYAKWNAARILRAMREGQDPNATNPKHEEPAAAPAEPSLEDELADLAMPRPEHHHRASIASMDLPSPPPKHPFDSAPSPRLLNPDNDTQAGSSAPFTPPSPMSQHSPINPPDQIPSPYSRVSVSPQQGVHPHQPTYQPVSPPVPAPGSRRQSLHVPSAPAEAYTPPPTESQPTFPGPSVMAKPQAPTSMPWPPGPMQGQGPQSEVSSPGYAFPPPHQQLPHQQLPQQLPHQQLSQQPQFYQPPPGPVPAPSQAQAHVQPPAEVDERVIAEAQKHAKWAISALNFDDVPTAVKELKKALSALGVQ